MVPTASMYGTHASTVAAGSLPAPPMIDPNLAALLPLAWIVVALVAIRVFAPTWWSERTVARDTMGAAGGRLLAPSKS